MKLITDAIVIGAGAVGCATAFALTQVGIRRVALVDKGPLVSGMTRRNAGLVHSYQPHELLTRLALTSLDMFQQWATRIGGKSLFVETGLVVLAGTAPAFELVRNNTDQQARAGAETRMLSPQELRALVPSGNFERLAGAAYQARAGYADAAQTAQAFAARAKENGTQILTGALVRRILVDRTLIKGVETTTGSIEAPVVVVAAGGWSERLLAPLGISLNLRFRQGALVFVEQPPTVADGHPTFLDPERGLFLRPHSYRLSAIGGLDRRAGATSMDSLDEYVSPETGRALTSFAAECVPALAGASQKRAHTIVYDEPADGLPALGRVDGIDGLFLAVGFGMNAFAVAPGAGAALAQWIVDGTPPMDLSAFRPTRSMPRRA